MGLPRPARRVLRMSFPHSQALLSMTKPSEGKLNLLERTLPEGLLVDAGWMTKHGYSTGLRSQYVSAGWLVQPTRGTFKRPLGT